MKAVLIGYGEVGKGLYEVLSKHHNIAIHDPAAGFSIEGYPLTEIDLLLITIPFGPEFAVYLQGYQKMVAPKVTIIFSTVPVGTCRKLDAIHSPIEGRHDNMAESIRTWPRWIGGIKDEYGLVGRFFVEAGLDVMPVMIPEVTEFLKLRSLAIYGIDIEIARYSKQVADQLGIDYDVIKRYDACYNDLVSTMLGERFQRPILDPPVGKIGGHCILKGMKLLQDDSDRSHPFIQTVLDFNEEK